MITEDILEWVATLPKWQQKLSYVLVEKKVTEELEGCLYNHAEL